MNLSPLVFVYLTICLFAQDCLAQNIATEQSPKNRLNRPIKVMSFNIRFGTAPDGENHWDKRRELVAETIEVFGPDLLGVQEALKSQTEFLSSKLVGYRFIGRGREKEPEQGESCGIYFRSDRFELIDSGHFWLSESPDIPGSVGWDAALPRLVSWVRLKDLESTYAEFVFANTHFDHVGRKAQLQSAHTIRTKLVDENEIPVVISGDFNCGENSEPYEALTNPEGQRILIDSYRVSNPEGTDQECSFTSWKGNRTGQRIDWILHSADWTCLKAEINHTQDKGRNPSDHYPVEAVLRFTAKTER